MRSKRKGAKSIMPSVHNERKSASRECRVSTTATHTTYSPNPPGHQRHCQRPYRQPHIRQTAATKALKSPPVTTAKHQLREACPADNDSCSIRGELTTAKQRKPKEEGTVPYIKRKVRHKADRPNNNEWRGESLTSTAATAARSARKPGISSQATATQGNECLRICRL